MSFFGKIFRRPPKKTWIIISNKNELLVDENFKKLISELKTFIWIHKKYVAESALVEKSGSSIRQNVGQKFDKNYFEIVEKGWTHDHCEICNSTISEEYNEENDNEIEGYNSENIWLCNFCYDNFVKTDDLLANVEKFKIAEK